MVNNKMYNYMISELIKSNMPKLVYIDEIQLIHSLTFGSELNLINSGKFYF